MRNTILALVVSFAWLALGCTAPSNERDASTHRDAALADGARADAFTPDDASSTIDVGGPPLVRSEDFAEATGEVRNPDRGLYWLDWNDASALVLVEVSLADQCDVATLPASVLDALRTRLAAHRAGGRRAIVRFLYANDGVLNRCGLADATSLDIVLGHVSQLAPVLTEYEDVIAFFQAGFFGMWGEWNQEFAPAGTSLSLTHAQRDALILALLAAVPARRDIQVRRPRFRDELMATDSERARVGFHDDCFLASADDYGTYDGTRSISEWKTYVRGATLSAPFGGESCFDDATYTSCASTLAEMANLRIAYMHEGYHPDVVARWSSEGCLEPIRRRLGYRMVVRAVEAPASIARGEELRVHVELENVGFAPPYEQRRIQLVLRNNSGGVATLGSPTTIDARSWAPIGTHAFTVSAAIPSDLAIGDWAVRLALLEDASDLPAYAMLLANDARVRDETRRENIVASIRVTP